MKYWLIDQENLTYFPRSEYTNDNGMQAQILDTTPPHILWAKVKTSWLRNKCLRF